MLLEPRGGSRFQGGSGFELVWWWRRLLEGPLLSHRRCRVRLGWNLDDSILLGPFGTHVVQRTECSSLARGAMPVQFEGREARAQEVASLLTDPSVYPMMVVGLICAVKLLKVARALWGLADASAFFMGNQSDF